MLVATLARNGLSAEQAETLIENMLHQEGLDAASNAEELWRLQRRAVHMLCVELLDDVVPAGDLLRFARSVRQSLAEGDEYESSPLGTIASQVVDVLWGASEPEGETEP